MCEWAVSRLQIFLKSAQVFCQKGILSLINKSWSKNLPLAEIAYYYDTYSLKTSEALRQIKPKSDRLTSAVPDETLTQKLLESN